MWPPSPSCGTRTSSIAYRHRDGRGLPPAVGAPDGPLARFPAKRLNGRHPAGHSTRNCKGLRCAGIADTPDKESPHGNEAADDSRAEPS
jgi:hypothetical protein